MGSDTRSTFASRPKPPSDQASPPSPSKTSSTGTRGWKTSSKTSGRDLHQDIKDRGGVQEEGEEEDEDERRDVEGGAAVFSFLHLRISSSDPVGGLGPSSTANRSAPSFRAFSVIAGCVIRYPTVAGTVRYRANLNISSGNLVVILSPQVAALNR